MLYKHDPLYSSHLAPEEDIQCKRLGHFVSELKKSEFIKVGKIVFACSDRSVSWLWGFQKVCFLAPKSYVAETVCKNGAQGRVILKFKGILVEKNIIN